MAPRRRVTNLRKLQQQHIQCSAKSGVWEEREYANLTPISHIEMLLPIDYKFKESKLVKEKAEYKCTWTLVDRLRKCISVSRGNSLAVWFPRRISSDG